MTLDGANVLAIVLMGLVTYFTRLAGLFVAGRSTLAGRRKAALDAIPIALLTAVIAPTLLTSGVAESLAGVVTILASACHCWRAWQSASRPSSFSGSPSDEADMPGAATLAKVRTCQTAKGMGRRIPAPTTGIAKPER